MTYREKCNLIFELYQKMGSHLCAHLKASHKDLYQEILDYSKDILSNSKYTFNIRAYWYINQLTGFPKCEICGKPILSNRYTLTEAPRFCSLKCSLQSPACISKRKQTNLEKYGVDNPLKSKEIRHQIKQTNLERYGVENPYQADAVKDKIKATHLNRRGVEYIGQSKESRYKAKVKRAINRYQQILQDDLVEILCTQEEFINSLDFCTDIFKWKCKKCGKVFESALNSNFFSTLSINAHNGIGSLARCPHCFPFAWDSKIYQGISKSENDLKDFIKSIYSGEILFNGKSVLSPKELDIYIPDKNLAIEYNGLYWHSSAVSGIPKNHLIKTELCEKQGIQLIHIFEDDWKLKPEIVKSRLKNLFGVYDKTIYARRCIIKLVNSREASEFFNKNHLQGYVSSKINIGLFYNDELVSCMAFSKPRYNKKYEYELIRFANKLNHHIPGSASKLLTYFEKTYNPKTLISYADRCWSMGSVYKKLGFTYLYDTKPNYFYWSRQTNIRESRLKYQKHKLPTLLGNKFDPNLTEAMNMEQAGYFKIFDCGNMVFEKRYNV